MVAVHVVEMARCDNKEHKHIVAGIVNGYPEKKVLQIFKRGGNCVAFNLDLTLLLACTPGHLHFFRSTIREKAAAGTLAWSSSFLPRPVRRLLDLLVCTKVEQG